MDSSVGRYVKSFKIGDRVIPDNSYPRKTNNKLGGIITNTASKRIHVFNEAELIKIPDAMSDVEAAAFSLSALTANSIIKKANLKKGYKILVTSLFSNTSLSCLEILKGIAANVQMFSMHIGKIGDLYVSLHRSKGLLWKKRRICIR